MSEELSLLSQVEGREALRRLDRESQGLERARRRELREIDRRQTASYDVAVLLRKKGEEIFLYLSLEFKDKQPPVVFPKLLELPSTPTEEVPNPVKHALEHPMAIYAAAGVATEEFFADQSEAA